MFNWMEVVSRYFEVNAHQKDLGKQRDKLNKQLKSAMGEKTQKEVGDFVVTKQTQERTSMDKDKVVEILKQHGHTGAIKTLEVPDEEALEELIFHGSLDADDLAEAVKVKYVEVLSVKKKKKENKKAQATKEERKRGTDEVF